MEEREDPLVDILFLVFTRVYFQIVYCIYCIHIIYQGKYSVLTKEVRESTETFPNNKPQGT